MSIYFLETRQVVPASLTEVWEFFSRPQNLERITPKELDFEIIKITGGEKAHSGQMIEYRVTVPPGKRMKWLTEITHVEEGKFFVDEQRVGPYKIWHHEHFFEEVDGGVEMRDTITYKLPLGFIGRLFHPYVKKQLDRIFDFRSQVVEEIFP